MTFSDAQAIAIDPTAYTGAFPFRIGCGSQGKVAEQLGDDLSDSFDVEVTRERGYNSCYHERPSRVLSILVTGRRKAVA